jgi:hypothetical protein
MADFDPSGGGSEWTDTGSALTPTGDETIGDGTDDADLQSVSTGSVNNQTIVRKSPGDDLQTKIDATPTGGTLWFEPGTHDVATMGTGVITKPITLKWAGGLDAPGSVAGAIVVNNGSDSVAGPIFDVQTDNGTRHFGAAFENPVIDHQDTGSAIKVQTPFVEIKNPFLYGGGVADRLIYATNTGWALRIKGGRIGQATTNIYDDAIGGFNILDGTQVLGGTTGIRAGQGWRIRADFNQDIGVKSIGDGNVVWGSRFESGGTGIVISPSSDPDSARGPDFIAGACEFRSLSDVCIEFDDCQEVMCYPHGALTDGTSSGAAIRMTSNANRCLQLLTPTQYNLSWDIANSFRPGIDFIGSPRMTDARRADITQPVAGMGIWNTSDGLPNYYDGADWVLPDGSTT